MKMRLLYTVPLAALLSAGAWAAEGDDSATIRSNPPSATEVDPEKSLPMPAESFGEVDETLGNPHAEWVVEGEGQLPRFEQLDADGNGRLSESEVADIDPIKEQFQAADADQDGALDEAEFSAFETRMDESGEDSPATESRPSDEPRSDSTATETR